MNQKMEKRIIQERVKYYLKVMMNKIKLKKVVVMEISLMKTRLTTTGEIQKRINQTYLKMMKGLVKLQQKSTQNN